MPDRRRRARAGAGNVHGALHGISKAERIDPRHVGILAEVRIKPVQRDGIFRRQAFHRVVRCLGQNVRRAFVSRQRTHPHVEVRAAHQPVALMRQYPHQCSRLQLVMVVLQKIGAPARDDEVELQLFMMMRNFPADARARAANLGWLLGTGEALEVFNITHPCRLPNAEGRLKTGPAFRIANAGFRKMQKERRKTGKIGNRTLP